MLNYQKLDKQIDRSINETNLTIPDEFIEEVIFSGPDECIKKPFENREAEKS
jgi:hypothetical protein